MAGPLDQRIKLLVENEEIGAANLLGALPVEKAANQAVAGFDGIDIQPPVRQLLAGFRACAAASTWKRHAVGIRNAADKFPIVLSLPQLKQLQGSGEELYVRQLQRWDF